LHGTGYGQRQKKHFLRKKAQPRARRKKINAQQCNCVQNTGEEQNAIGA